MNTKRFGFGAVILAAGVGAAAVLLSVPRTRMHFQRRARDGQKQVNAALKKGLRTLASQRKRASKALEEGRVRWQNVQGHAQQALQEGREAATRIADHSLKAAAEVKAGLERLS